MTSVQTSPDRSRLAISGNDEILVWDISDPASPTQIAQLTAYGSRVYSVYFLSDDNTLVGSGSAKNVRLWQTDPNAAAKDICDRRGSAITEQEWTDRMKGIDFSDPCD